jgi:acyl-homoserine lactone synthase
MIYVIDSRNRDGFPAQIEEMFRIRHDIYVGRRGWSALKRPDGRDIDQFDTDRTVYLLGLDEEARVTAGLRLNPTTGPHLIRDIFPHTVTNEPIPVGEHIYEFTRWFVVKERVSSGKKSRVAGELLVGMLEYGKQIGLTHISLCCDAFFWKTMRDTRWDVRRLGPVTRYPEGKCIAVLFEVSERMIQNTREVRGVTGDVLVYADSPDVSTGSTFNFKLAA